MLNDKIIDKLVERLVNRIEKGNIYVLEQIGYSIKKIGELSSSKAQALQQILKYGGSYDKIINKLAEITDMNVRDIYKMFEEVAKKDYQFAKQFYDYQGIDYIPWEKNIALQNHVKVLADIAVSDYINLSRTTALGFGIKDSSGNFIFKGLKQTYYDVIDEAVLSIAQGKDTFQQQMFKTVKELGGSGLKIMYESGHTRRLDSAVRMNLQGALRDMHNKTQEMFGEQFGANGIEISVHSNPAPDHEEAQGRQFSIEEYEKLQESGIAKDYKSKKIDLHIKRKDNTTSPNFRPISQWNCYHWEFSIVLGVSEPEYTDKQLKEIIDNNHKGFEYEGKHYTNYEGTQLQRSIELSVRRQRDILSVAKASNNEKLIYESKQIIDQLVNKYHELSKISGLPTKLDRLRIS